MCQHIVLNGTLSALRKLAIRSWKLFLINFYMYKNRADLFVFVHGHPWRLLPPTAKLSHFISEKFLFSRFFRNLFYSMRSRYKWSHTMNFAISWWAIIGVYTSSEPDTGNTRHWYDNLFNNCNCWLFARGMSISRMSDVILTLMFSFLLYGCVQHCH